MCILSTTHATPIGMTKKRHHPLPLEGLPLYLPRTLLLLLLPLVLLRRSHHQHLTRPPPPPTIPLNLGKQFGMIPNLLPQLRLAIITITVTAIPESQFIVRHAQKVHPQRTVHLHPPLVVLHEQFQISHHNRMSRRNADKRLEEPAAMIRILVDQRRHEFRAGSDDVPQGHARLDVDVEVQSAGFVESRSSAHVRLVHAVFFVGEVGG
mmetsp:Transcript_19608/g.30798  ORF Transcript_19608/g.30798 Transcript_19608/m.30798 type:complete len:208 (-) Transcript_19608:118-741(-)